MLLPHEEYPSIATIIFLPIPAKVGFAFDILILIVINLTKASVKTLLIFKWLLLYMTFSKQDLLKEITFRTSRSGGKGGQNVNKVSSKVELNINLKSSLLFTEEEKELLVQKLANRINSDGVLQVITEEERSQLHNKEKSLDKLIILLKKALFKPKPRKPSKPKRSAIEKRLKSKQLTALKKLSRRGNFND